MRAQSRQDDLRDTSLTALAPLGANPRQVARWRARVSGRVAAGGAIWTELERFYLSLGDLPGIRAADFAAPHRPAATP